MIIREGLFRVPDDLEQLDNHAETGERFYQSIVAILKKVLWAQGHVITIRGAENIPAFGGALLAMNHTGYFDFIFGGMPAYLRGRRLVRFMAKKEIFDKKIVGALMRGMRHVSVDRAQGSGSVDDAVLHLRSGRLVGIFPEATISRSFELKEFKTGAARIAATADVPLIPMACWGSQRIWTKGGKKHLGRTKTPVMLHVGTPIPVTGDADADTAALHAAMSALLDAVRADYAASFGEPAPGADWMPAALGGSAPTPEQANAQDDAARAAKAAARAAAAADKEAKADRALAKRVAKSFKRLRKEQ